MVVCCLLIILLCGLAIAISPDNAEICSLQSLSTVKGLKFAHINIRSLLPKIDILSHDMFQSEIDLLAISESWLKESIGDGFICLDGYNLERLDCAVMSKDGTIKGGGGICVYIKSSILYNINRSSWVSSKDIEVLYLTLKFPNCRDIMFVLFYHPPEGNLHSALSEISTIVDYYETLPPGKDIIFMGDMNVDLLANTSSADDINHFCSEHRLKQLIQEPTRLGRYRNTLIDHVYSNSAYISHSGTFDIGLSDHKLIYVVKKKMTDKHPKKYVWCRDLRSYNPEEFRNALASFNWGRYYALKDPNVAWDYFYSVLYNMVSIFCPYRRIYIDKDRPPWYSREIIELAASWEHILKVAKKKKDDTLLETAKSLRNKLKTDITNAKTAYFKELLHTNASDSKNFWHNVKKIIIGSSASKTVSRVIDPSTGLISQPSETPGLINCFFTEIGPKLASVIPPSLDPCTLSQLMIPAPDIDVVSPEWILSYLKKVSPSKSSGCPDISMRLYLDAFPVLAEQLAFLYNLTLKTPVFRRYGREGLIPRFLRRVISLLWIIYGRLA